MPMTQRLLEQWAQRSPREQRLTLITLLLCLGFIALFAIQQARFTINRLDHDIQRMSTDLVNFHHQIARRQSVEARFAQVASQHSSAWSESEIRDRLRQEIYRLANRIPPGLDENGIPLSTSAEGGALVSIPRLGQGHLEDSDQGYREYRISVQIPPAPVEDMVAFLERLQCSPQSLRIDRIDLRRDASGNEVRADLDITRIVVDTDASILNGEALTERPTQRILGSDLSRWVTEGGLVSSGVNSTTLIEAQGAQAKAWVEWMLPPNTSYEAELTLRSAGACTVSVVPGISIISEESEVHLDAADGIQRIVFRFTTPLDANGDVPVRLPVIRLDSINTSVYFYQLELREVLAP